MSMKKQRIILVDDHEVVRLGLKSLLERHPQFDVVGEAGSAREALEQVAALKPDVVVMDIRLPGTSGIEACEQIVSQYPNAKVIMLTSYAEDEMLFSAIRAGASGYILKQIGSDDLVKAIELSGAAKRCWIPRSPSACFRKCAARSKKRKHPPFPISASRRNTSCCWSPKARPTVRSPRVYSSAKGRYGITFQAFCPN